MTEPDWSQVRRRARRRAGAQMALVLAPFMAVVATLFVLRPHDYPEGDLRNEPLFWAALAIGTSTFVITLVAGAIRELRGPRP